MQKNKPFTTLSAYPAEDIIKNKVTEKSSIITFVDRLISLKLTKFTLSCIGKVLIIIIVFTFKNETLAPHFLWYSLLLFNQKTDESHGNSSSKNTQTLEQITHLHELKEFTINFSVLLATSFTQKTLIRNASIGNESLTRRLGRLVKRNKTIGGSREGSLLGRNPFWLPCVVHVSAHTQFPNFYENYHNYK